MPACRKCGKHFSNRLKVDGRVRVMNRRKFCLSCSPFGVHNTKDLTKQPAPLGEKRCPRCTRLLPIGEFYKRRNRSGFLSYCKQCVSDQTMERQRLVKMRSIEYKGGSCVLCGYNKHPAALEFHHLDPTQKEFDISLCKLKDFERVKPELDKCVLVCSNCHREFHAGAIALPATLTAHSSQTS